MITAMTMLTLLIGMTSVITTDKHDQCDQC
jgi:hypothetical protein